MIGIGTTLNQRFLLEKELGRGGMGSVYSATDQLLQRVVAIKVLKEQGGEEVGKRLRLEAQIAARLLHDNVVRIYDFGEAEGTSYLVMEQVEGTSYVKRWRSLLLVDRLRILAQVAEALDYAHHQGVIHRDVKPGNVLLNQQDVPKLSDFGLSMIAEQGDESGLIRGTPHYMSPEQARAKRLDFRSDLYSLGVMIYEAATGNVPFTGASMAIIAQHAGTKPEPPRARNAAISVELERLILSLLEKKPEARPTSGSAVSAALLAEIERIRARDNTAQPGGQAEPAAPTEAAPRPKVASAPDISTLTGLGSGTSLKASARENAAAPAGSRPAPAPPVPSLDAADLVTSQLVRKMLRVVLAEPVMLTPDERYLFGHYLAYLLIGSRRKGLLVRRRLERRNADRARLILALTYALAAGGTDEAIQEAAALIDQGIEVRTALNPVVLAKFLSWRDTPTRRKLLRQTRKAVQEASIYARKQMTDDRGSLNPGLIPASLDDLRKIAPPRNEVDDELVARWNRLAEVWRDHPDFRIAALRYASGRLYRDPAAEALWAEVVYPLIELARWQRRSRTRVETLWDLFLGKVLHVSDAGNSLDRMLTRNVPAVVVAQLDDSARLLDQMVSRSEPDDDLGGPEEPDLERVPHLAADMAGLDDFSEETGPARRGLERLVEPDPTRFLQGQLQELWKEAANALRQAGPAGLGKNPDHRHIAVGPYRLVVVASIRGTSAGQVVLQGMGNRQIELLTPSFRTTGSSSRPIMAVWLYRDHSLVISHLDFKGIERYVIWDASRGHQVRFDDPGDVARELANLGKECPDQLESALSRRFRPRNKV